MTSPADQLKAAANRVATKADCDVILVSGPMDYETQDEVNSLLRTTKRKRKKLLFLLCTPGGIPEAAYRVSRAFQHSYEYVSILVGGWCKSAGTLCVIGANEIVMADEAELGPLDIQVLRRDEIGERDSGLVVEEALRVLNDHAFAMFEDYMLRIKTKSEGIVTFKTAAELAISLTNGLLTPIYSRIDPEKLGANARSLNIASAYGRRLVIKSKNLKPDASVDVIDSLTYSYPSHGFVIDRREAESLFNRVRTPNVEEAELLRILGSIVLIPSAAVIVKFLNVQEIHDEQATDPNKSKKGSVDDSAKKGVVKPIKRGSAVAGNPTKAA